MWFDGQRQPNTIYAASVSRGKDSTAMLRAIQLMGFPLDIIVSVDIWATKDIPAELPPMVKFKEEYDKKVFDMFGVPVTRTCAINRSKTVNVERERERAVKTAIIVRQIVIRRLLLQSYRKWKALWANQGFPPPSRRMVPPAQDRMC